MQRTALATHILTQLTQATQPPKRKDTSGVYSCVAYIRCVRCAGWKVQRTARNHYWPPTVAQDNKYKV